VGLPIIGFGGGLRRLWLDTTTCKSHKSQTCLYFGCWKSSSRVIVSSVVVLSAATILAYITGPMMLTRRMKKGGGRKSIVKVSTNSTFSVAGCSVVVKLWVSSVNASRLRSRELLRPADLMTRYHKTEITKDKKTHVVEPPQTRNNTVWKWKCWLLKIEKLDTLEIKHMVDSIEKYNTVWKD